MSRRSKFPRTFKGYVALQRQGGPIIWGSLNRDAEATRQFFAQHNPMQTPIIRAVRITFDDPPANAANPAAQPSAAVQAGGRVSPSGSGPATD